MVLVVVEYKYSSNKNSSSFNSFSHTYPIPFSPNWLYLASYTYHLLSCYMVICVVAWSLPLEYKLHEGRDLVWFIPISPGPGIVARRGT